MISQSTRSGAITATLARRLWPLRDGEWATLPVSRDAQGHVSPIRLGKHVAGRPRAMSRMLRLLRRHSKVALALGAVGLLFVVYVIASAPAQYRANGSLVMLNPPVMPSIENRPLDFKANPYAETGYTGVDVARIVVLRMKSEGEKNYIRDKLGVKGQFDIGANLGINSTPLVDITVTEPQRRRGQGRDRQAVAALRRRPPGDPVRGHPRRHRRSRHADRLPLPVEDHGDLAARPRHRRPVEHDPPRRRGDLPRRRPPVRRRVAGRVDRPAAGQAQGRAAANPSRATSR